MTPFSLIGEQMAQGGAGDDLYFLSDGGQILEAADGGYDVAVFADTEFEIPLGVEFVRTSLYSNNLTYEIEGNSEDNHVSVLSARGWINGLAGNDLLTTGNARDRIDGGVGDDLIWTTGGNKNLLVGGFGTDVIIGGERLDTIFGGLSDEQIAAGASQSSDGDLICGGDIYVLEEGDRYLDNGNIELAEGDIFVFSKLPFARKDGLFYTFGEELPLEGQDDFSTNIDLEILQSTLNKLILGDFFLLEEGSGDQIKAGNGDDLIITQSGDDTISAGLGNDIVIASGGNDTIETSGGNDLVLGGVGTKFCLNGSGQ